MLKLHDLYKVYRTDEVETVALNGVNLEIVDGLSEGEMLVVDKGKAESRWRNSEQRQSDRGRRMMMRGMRPRK